MSTPYALSMIADASSSAIHFRPAKREGALACWLALPDRIVADRSPLVAVHGIRRGARQPAELFATRANALGRPVIAPVFDRHNWPRYQQTVRGGRADLALIELIGQLRNEGICRTDRFELSGFSGGAQFAHRFSMMHPNLVERLTVASAGWYTFPDTEQWPRGLSVGSDPHHPWSAVTEERFRHFLTIPTQVCVGADDTLRDANMRSDELIDVQQGQNRLVRGIRWAQALKKAALSRGLTPHASFNALSACGHDFRQCVVTGGLDRIVIPVNSAAQLGLQSALKGCEGSSKPYGARLRLLRTEQ